MDLIFLNSLLIYHINFKNCIVFCGGHVSIVVFIYEFKKNSFGIREKGLSGHFSSSLTLSGTFVEVMNLSYVDLLWSILTRCSAEKT